MAPVTLSEASKNYLCGRIYLQHAAFRGEINLLYGVFYFMILVLWSYPQSFRPHNKSIPPL